MSKIVLKTVQIEITEDQIISFLPTINRSFDQQDGDVLITIDEVKSNPKLLDYIVDEIVKDSVLMGLGDPFEFWNNDGWCDVQDYR